MSRTAGLGSGEYVAINNTSVVAFLMGLASVLALLNPFLLLFAVAAVVLAVMALIQIRSSNGTQTGQAFAIVAILLALLFGGTTGGKMALAQAERRRNEAEVVKVINLLGERLSKREYTQAYATLFGDKFKENFSEEVFITRWEGVERDAGRVVSVNWAGRMELEPARGTAGPRAATKANFRFEKFPQDSPLTLALVEQDGEWVIDQIGEMFNADAERRRAQERNPRQSPMQGPQFQTGP
jgi:NADH:ubiquinone oxidoreductase subunit K